MLKISAESARRYILGKQGLWPGRRWRGIQGTEAAMRAVEYLQLDPLRIIARSQDIQLHSRVLDYSPEMWETVTYHQRKFFDWGGWLAVRPMDELPYWRVAMRREREGAPGCDGRIHRMAHEHADAIAEMLAILRERGTVTNRDFAMASRKRTQSYRGRKDSALALYYLWRTGQVMTHHRENFERVYALTETVAPDHLNFEIDEAKADRFILAKEINFNGLWRTWRAADAFNRGAANNLDGGKTVLETLADDGEIIEVQVDGWKGRHFISGHDLELLTDLSSGSIPLAWTPLETTTTEEVVILAPLDPVSARGRAKGLFGFDYVWEVYKPEPLRKYGYYTLPVLWGDRLVARFDSKYERTRGTFRILGFWLENSTSTGGEELSNNSSFAEALARGFARFTKFLSANKLDAQSIQEPLLRKAVSSVMDQPSIH